MTKHVARRRAGWCAWAERACPPNCPIPSVDNKGQPYPGCALVRLKSQEELDAELAANRGETDMTTKGDCWGVWCVTAPGCEPAAAGWLGVGGKPLILSRAMADAFAEAGNRVNGTHWTYEVREPPPASA